MVQVAYYWINRKARAAVPLESYVLQMEEGVAVTLSWGTIVLTACCCCKILQLNF